MDEHKNILRALPAFVLLTVLSLSLLAATQMQSFLFAPLALLSYIALSFYVLRVFPAVFILLLWFIFIRITVLLSGISIEGGAYMHEILMHGSPSGAFIRLTALYATGILFLCILIQVLLRLVSPMSKRDHAEKIRSADLWSSAIFGFTALFCLLAVWVGMQNGFPLLSGVDRIAYWREIDNRFFYFFLGNRTIVAVLLGLVFAVTQDTKRIIACVLFVVMMLISILFAEKFTSVSSMLFAFVTPVFLLNQAWLKGAVGRVLVLGSVLCVITVPVIMVVYGVYDDPEKALERFQSRVSAQGQLWFYADKHQDDYFKLDEPKLTHNLRAITTASPDKVSDTPPYLGVKDFMSETMERSRYKHYRERGITLTMGLEPYLLKLFGWLGMVPAYLFLLAIYGAQLAYLYFAVQRLDPVRIILVSKLLVWTNFGLNQGYLWFILGLKPMALMTVILMYELAMRVMEKHRQENAYVD